MNRNNKRTSCTWDATECLKPRGTLMLNKKQQPFRDLPFVICGVKRQLETSNKSRKSKSQERERTERKTEKKKKKKKKKVIIAFFLKAFFLHHTRTPTRSRSINQRHIYIRISFHFSRRRRVAKRSKIDYTHVFGNIWNRWNSWNRWKRRWIQVACDRNGTVLDGMTVIKPSGWINSAA